VCVCVCVCVFLFSQSDGCLARALPRTKSTSQPTTTPATVPATIGSGHSWYPRPQSIGITALPTSEPTAANTTARPAGVSGTRAAGDSARRGCWTVSETTDQCKKKKTRVKTKKPKKNKKQKTNKHLPPCPASSDPAPPGAGPHAAAPKTAQSSAAAAVATTPSKTGAPRSTSAACEAAYHAPS
jgi:hypothetical protein